MAYTKASEHTPSSPLTFYCTPDDVRVYLAGVAADDAGSPFEALLSRPRIDESLAKLVQVAKKLVDRTCHRDFDNHEDVEIAVDGAGSDVLHLMPLGFAPLIDMTALSIDDTDEDTDDYILYLEDGIIARTTFSTTEIPAFIRGMNTFTLGRQNVVATISWGYTSVPVDVEMAAAYWTGALLLNPLDAATDKRAPGVNMLAQSADYGDLKIGLGATHPAYYKMSERLVKLAKSILTNGYAIPLVTAPDIREASIANARYY